MDRILSTKRGRWCVAAFLLAAACLSGCAGPKPVTMDLEEARQNRHGDAVVQAMEDYQVISTKKYFYPGLKSWLDAGRTASIYGTEPGRIVVFTQGEDGDFQWQDVYYSYGFYDVEYMQEEKGGDSSPLMISPVLLSADGEAVAYQTMRDDGFAVVVSRRGEETVFLDSPVQEQKKNGAERSLEDEYDWNQFEYGWSADGETLFYYKMGKADSGRNNLLFPSGVYAYDKSTGRSRLVWEPMELKMPRSADRYPAAESLVADVDGNQAVMFLLFDDASGCPDVQLWNQNGKVQVSYPSLPENPCIQLRIGEGIYYYQAEGEIRKARLGASEQWETILYTDPQLQSFLVSGDGQKVFTIEKRAEKEDICIYICDEKQNWYKQVVYMGSEGAVSLQLSEDELQLLVECRNESESQALVMTFYDQPGE